MATRNSVWGIEIGQCALKAVRLRPGEDGKVELVAFDIVEHAKILSQPDAEPDEAIKAALTTFAGRNEWQGDAFVIGVPGQQTFARFTKLPPADPKKIPDLVKYEAGQQIPFDMDDVVWDYQVFQAPESPDIEVGIFAMRKDLIRKYIDAYAAVGITPTAIQSLPAALYNFARFDQPNDEGGATVLIDVGAQNTDLIVVEKNGAWTRNIPLGGNSFTEALIKAFKLSFSKAENLKRTAASSKYARQIFQAMRPVFAELVAEVQRSLGFYSSTHRDVELTRVLALGNAFRLPGLQKYLENNLTLGGGVGKLESFNHVVLAPNINREQFNENVLSLPAAYGLAVQGLGMSAISASLLPLELARVAVWKKKRVYFAAAAACFGLAAVLPWTRSFMDQAALAAAPDARRKADDIVAEARRFAQQFQEVSQNTGSQEESIRKLTELQKDRPLVPRLLSLPHEALPEVAPNWDKAQTPEDIKKLVTSDPARYGRTKRKQIFIERLSLEFSKNIEGLVPAGVGSEVQSQAAAFSGGGPMGMVGGGARAGGGAPFGMNIAPAPTSEEGEGAPGFYVRVVGRLLYGDDQASAASFLLGEYLKNIVALGNRAGLGFYVLPEDPKNEPGKQNPRLVRVAEYYELRTLGGPSIMPTRPGQTPDAPGAGVAPGLEDKSLEDPMTGESMKTDWRFEIGFKVKLGDAPPPAEGGDGSAPPGGG
ncbi:MAG: type IV pilus assembly protein PilM [Phycisphaerae bacterium]